MNINDYEKLLRNERLMSTAVNSVLYEASTRTVTMPARFPGQQPSTYKHQGPPDGGWTDEDRDCAKRMVEAIFRCLVDDYTTPGCTCDYCTWFDAGDGRPRTLMCRQRWEALTHEQRLDIGESIAD